MTGCRTREVTSAEEALETALSRQVDLVLMDSRLSKLDGFDVARILKSSPRTALLPVLLLASRPDRALLAFALQSGAADLLPKPVPQALLEERTWELLRLRGFTRPAGSSGPHNAKKPPPRSAPLPSRPARSRANRRRCRSTRRTAASWRRCPSSRTWSSSRAWWPPAIANSATSRPDWDSSGCACARWSPRRALELADRDPARLPLTDFERRALARCDADLRACRDALRSLPLGEATALGLELSPIHI